MFLQLCERLIPGTYASFGDKKQGVLPAVMFPLEKGVDRYRKKDLGVEK